MRDPKTFDIESGLIEMHVFEPDTFNRLYKRYKMKRMSEPENESLYSKRENDINTLIENGQSTKAINALNRILKNPQPDPENPGQYKLVPEHGLIPMFGYSVKDLRVTSEFLELKGLSYTSSKDYSKLLRDIETQLRLDHPVYLSIHSYPYMKVPSNISDIDPNIIVSHNKVTVSDFPGDNVRARASDVFRSFTGHAVTVIGITKEKHQYKWIYIMDGWELPRDGESYNYAKNLSKPDVLDRFVYKVSEVDLEFLLNKFNDDGNSLFSRYTYDTEKDKDGSTVRLRVPIGWYMPGL